MGLMDLAIQTGQLKGLYQGQMQQEELALKKRKVGVQEGMLDVAKGKLALDVYETKETIGIKKDYLKIAQADLGLRIDSHMMKREMHSWKREDRETQKMKQQGILQASQAGGYEGVIDYLKGVDPVQAIKIHADKLKMENQMMQNEVVKAQVPAKKAAALLEGHQVLARIGFGVLNAPPGQQQETYKNAMPMVKKIWPGASGDLEKDSPQLLTSFAMSMPQNQIYGGGKQERTLGQQIVSLDSKINEAVALGKNAQTDPQLKAMMIDRQALKDKQEKVGLQNLSMQNKLAQDVQKRVDNYNKYLTQNSKDYTQFLSFSERVDGSLETYKNNQNNQVARGIVARTIAKMANGAGVMTDKDVDQVVRQSSVWQRYKSKFQGWSEGSEVNITEADMNSLIQVYEEIKGIVQNKQGGFENQMKAKISEDNKLHRSKVEMNSIMFPTMRISKEGDRRALLGQFPQLQGLPADHQKSFTDKYLKAQEAGDTATIEQLVNRLQQIAR